MDIETGEIYEISSDDELRRLADKLGHQLVPLTEEHAKELAPLSNRMRKRLLSGGFCICGSGKSFKKCCRKKYQQTERRKP